MFHLSDVESCDASYVLLFHSTVPLLPIIIWYSRRAVQIFYELFETYIVRSLSRVFSILLSADSTHGSHTQMCSTCLVRKNRGVTVYVTHLRRVVRHSFERGGIVELIGEDAFYQDVAAAISRVASEHQVFGGRFSQGG